MRRPTLSPARGTFAWLLQIGYTTVRLFGQNGLANHAAATAFYFLLSATPLLLLLSYAVQLLQHVAANSVPAAILMAALYEQLHLETLTTHGFIPQRAQLAVGGAGLLTLLLSSRWMVNAMQGAFNMIFPDRGRRTLVVSWILPLVILPVLFLLMALGALAQVTLVFLAQHDFIGSGNAHVLRALNALLSFGILWALLFAAYWSLPRRHPPARDAARFALLAAVSLTLLFALFGAFFELENYNSLYGALGGVIFVLIGGYFAFLLLYLWAQALYACGKADITALERLFLTGHGKDAGTLEDYVFGDTGRLLEKYGQTHPPGHVLIQEGAGDRTAYFLHAGRAVATKRTDTGVRRLGEFAEGQLFGEMAYLLNEPRTASVVADTEITVLALPPAILEELMQHSAPLSRRIIGTLCQRLERMNLTNVG